MASLASNGAQRNKEAKESERYERCNGKVRRKFEEGDYSALQMYKTLLSRTSQKELNNAAEIAEQGSVKL